MLPLRSPIVIDSPIDDSEYCFRTLLSLRKNSLSPHDLYQVITPGGRCHPQRLHPWRYVGEELDEACRLLSVKIINVSLGHPGVKELDIWGLRYYITSQFLCERPANTGPRRSWPSPHQERRRSHVPRTVIGITNCSVGHSL